MTSRWSLIAVLLLGALPTASAQPLPPKTIVWNQRNSQSEAYFGIVGEIERPGVYSAVAAQVTVQELIHRAGGFSRRGSPAVRIIRSGRSGQSIFVRPDGADALAANDLVVVDVLRDPRQPLAAAANDRPDRNVWVGLVGVSDHPEVVWVNPEQAQLPNIMKMLGQSPQLAKAVRTIPPPGLQPPGGQFDLLPNGSVLVFDRSLLVTANLPLFDVPQSLTAPAPAVIATTPTSDPAISSMPRLQVDAQSVPFTLAPNAQVPANPASLPAPGSRLAPPAVALPPQLPAGAEFPAVYAGPPVIVEPEAATEAELVGVPAVAPTPPPGFGLWQLLGIGGTVASLVGVALVSRQYLDRTPSDNAQIPAAIRNRMHSAPPLPPRRSFEPAPMTTESDVLADLEEDELRELLDGRLAIETEAPEFPTRMELRAAITKQSEPVYRLDDAAEQIDAPHFAARTALDSQHTFFTDAAETPAIPGPHFRRRPSRTEAAGPAAVNPSAFDGSAIERALSQLQEGLKS